MHDYNNDFIYSHDPRQEELMIEQNARDDYLAELAAEHVDHCPEIWAEDAFDFVGPPDLRFWSSMPADWTESDDIPF